ncbi:HlyD family type I secretion periplasmic adaptor subunit [Wolbachia endosymbiont of Brugia malayi]|uniref:HlyD family type I secretion periplasmic adaptor subunit n=1 Tax=unclassified Wolbachia TaxID=2640676 RepID=UPI00004C9343|nr:MULTISPECIES: HlyD family type I secretion periplasmic adaptor subunit [unclassified Wolbachia]AAW70898.1 Membrane-fusion protein [Wolbachia endosymbiont strain TRS of Brugia malayi]QCB61857.1 HlyD family type I secretion periplasmic adaptor subunit [Wolbachia endosymbiont of Brugia malayi]QIT36524.1 type I secretion membrane fusion, HlyD family protein [Wolbachia endosymbiont of Brugia pahangi]
MQGTKNKKKKYPKFLDKTFALIDAMVNFILKREGNNVNEVLRVTWGPLFFGLAVILIFFGIGGIWSAVAPIDGAVHASGEVIVSSNRKVIQHLGGGIISKILVKEGQVVKKGEPLVLLSDVNERANLSIIKEKLLSLLVTEARLIAIRGDFDTVEFPDEVKKLSNDELANKVMKNQIKLLNSQRKSILGKTDILQQRIKQLHNELVGLNSQLGAVFKQYNLIAEELETKRKLLINGHIGKPHILALEKQFAEIEGKVGYYRAAISQVQQKIGENELEIINVKNDSQERANTELKEVDTSIADLKERLMVAEDALARTVIRSPQDGIVTDIRYHTEGGVIQSGVPIMSIVPSNDDLIIDAKIQTRNIEEIISAQKKDSNIVSIDGLKGLKVKVRLSAYSSRRLSLINGIVSHISPDALDDPRLGRYYSVRVVIPKSELVQFKNVYLYPGMPAEVYIVTQSRTLLSFLFMPIIATVDRSFIER